MVTEDWETKTEALRAVGQQVPPRAAALTTSARHPVTGLALASGRPRHTVGLRLLTRSPRRERGLVRCSQDRVDFAACAAAR